MKKVQIVLFEILDMLFNTFILIMAITIIYNTTIKAFEYGQNMIDFDTDVSVEVEEL